MKHRTMLMRSSLVLLCAASLAGCTTIKGWFGGDGKKDDGKPNEPTELTKITPSVTVSKLWSANAGKGEGRMGVHQGPVVADGRVYAAAIEGGVHAYDLQTGKSVWQYKPEKKVELSVSGGPGVGEGLVVIGGLNGEVIALDAASGEREVAGHGAE